MNLCMNSVTITFFMFRRISQRNGPLGSASGSSYAQSVIESTVIKHERHLRLGSNLSAHPWRNITARAKKYFCNTEGKLQCTMSIQQLQELKPGFHV